MDRSGAWFSIGVPEQKHFANYCGFTVRNTWIQILSLSFTVCVALGKGTYLLKVGVSSLAKYG